ncbi:MAG: tetratricopeptide repeat protein [Nocardioides sp.]
MAEQRRTPSSGSGRPSRGSSSSSSRGQRAGSARPERGGSGDARGAKDDRRGGQSGSSRSGSAKPGKSTGDKSSKPAYGKRGDAAPSRSNQGRADSRPRRDSEEPRERAYAGPEIPADITGKELDRGIAAQLKSLPDRVQVLVARHLAAAGVFIDSDPELAYQHAKAAKSRAGRLAVVREAFGEAAYAAGHYAEALADLRAAKRMNGATAYLPIMADCHRALGQPQQAIKLAQSPSVRNFVPEAKAEMTIVESGARRDLGQVDSALRVLELAPLNSKSHASWVVRLRYAYADTLEAAGRLPEALQWFHRTVAVDGEQGTDAAERAEALEKRLEDQ